VSSILSKRRETIHCKVALVSLAGHNESILVKKKTYSTVSTEALLYTLVTDAHEDRYVATADVKGAYIHAEIDKYVLLRLDGEVVDVFCKLNPRYKDFVVMEGKKKVLYMYVRTCQVGITTVQIIR